MKYVMFTVKSKHGEFKMPVIFPEHMVHKEVADALVPMLRAQYPGKVVLPTSAGQLNSIEFNGELYGKSETLKLNSNPEDARIFRMHDYGAGFTG